jgi:hypothetical protein
MHLQAGARREVPDDVNDNASVATTRPEQSDAKACDDMRVVSPCAKSQYAPLSDEIGGHDEQLTMLGYK